MAKIYQRLLSKNIPRKKKKQETVDPHCINLLGEDSSCMVNSLVIPQKIVFFFFLQHD